jgi:hypothetical protein
MVPMHQGLIDKSFMLHILISTQYSPVPLPKFQMASRLKILMSSGSKKGSHIYNPFLSRNSQQVFPQLGPYAERYLLTGQFYISLDTSVYLKGPMKRASLHVPQKRGP